LNNEYLRCRCAPSFAIVNIQSSIITIANIQLISAMPNKITVLIIEDSALMRRELTKIISSDPELRVIGAARDGGEGLKMAKTLDPDVVTIDINLPDMDGITCLQHIMIETPRPCIMISAYTGKHSIETFEALELGAVDFVEKPSGEISRDIHKRAEDIIAKLKETGHVNLSVMTRYEAAPVIDKKEEKPAFDEKIPEKIVVIGVSTGGPRTLMQIIPFLPAGLNTPVLLIQHMPKKFTAGFAERLNNHSPLRVKEAQNGEALRNDVVYVAQGNSNLLMTRNHNGVFINLSKPSKDDLISPSVEKALGSAVDIFGKQVVGVILTGMGDDGAKAMERLYRLGGETITESKETAVIYGMPKEVIKRNAARVVAPSGEIAEEIVQALRRIDD